MLEHFRKFAKFGLILSTILLPMITSEVGSGIDMDGIGGSATLSTSNEDGAHFNHFISDGSRTKLNKRLRDVIFDMVRLEYI